MAKIALGCEPVVGSLAPSRKREYRVTNRLQEGKRPLYAVVFNFIDSRFFNVFATVGGNRVTVYQCLDGGVIAVLQSYIDEDKDESFYTVSWACNTDGTPLLVAGGINGIIRVIDAGNEKIHKSFVGHGDSVNEIRTQAMKPSLVVSASKDESVRLWNVHTGICILIFAGAGGHRNEVLSVDFHPSDIYRIASCGMDNTVKIWSMKDVPIVLPKLSGQGGLAACYKKQASAHTLVQLTSFKNTSQFQSVIFGSSSFSCDFHYNAAAVGCLMFSQNLQLDRLPCPLMEVPFSAVARMAQSGAGNTVATS
ncbi:transducin/WD40 repeat-like superfamily protein [Actinidia rufa]|uniref:Transducin/WD40 repeat-like superfamily protein n=1 Tax=Actinidia rufa TaxID=165716 RepID=A0A7J0G9G4_9ERIC|nr:transducin/WD40 repeat-like superfamily protein [Actinidia rufa]